MLSIIPTIDPVAESAAEGAFTASIAADQTTFDGSVAADGQTDDSSVAIAQQTMYSSVQSAIDQESSADLKGVPLTDGGLSRLKPLSRIVSLDLGSTKITAPVLSS
jgi:hypothetical protein